MRKIKPKEPVPFHKLKVEVNRDIYELNNKKYDRVQVQVFLKPRLSRKRKLIAHAGATIEPTEKTVGIGTYPMLAVDKPYRGQHIAHFTLAHLIDHVNEYMKEKGMNPNEFKIKGGTLIENVEKRR